VLTYASPHVAVLLAIHSLDGQGRKIAQFFLLFFDEQRLDTATASGIPRKSIRMQRISRSEFSPLASEGLRNRAKLRKKVCALSPSGEKLIAIEAISSAQ
jgi:hypothetical protein